MRGAGAFSGTLGGLAIINTSSEMRYDLGMLGTGGASPLTMKFELVELLIASIDADVDRVEKISERASLEDRVRNNFADFGVVGMLAQPLGVLQTGERSSLEETKLVPLRKVGRLRGVLGLRDTRFSRLRFDFFSPLAGSEMVDELKLCCMLVEGKPKLLLGNGEIERGC